MRPQDFETWFAQSGHPIEMRLALLAAWEAGWDAGIDYERWAEMERREWERQ